MIKEVLLFSIFFLFWADSEKLRGLLLYENQKKEVCKDMKCWNALTLKKKLYKTDRRMDDFTVCFRLNLLSYRGKGKTHNILQAKTNKYVYDERMNHSWTTGFHYHLRPVDGPGNGAVTIQTFNRHLQEVILAKGVYTIWPMYEAKVNANQWNSFCMGSSLNDQSIFLVRNGKTINKIMQPALWSDLNIGLDTSALDQFQV